MTTEEKARSILRQRDTRDLVDDFEATERVKRKEVPTVRGWIMDELERRDSGAFWTWMESDEASPRKYFI